MGNRSRKQRRAPRKKKPPPLPKVRREPDEPLYEGFRYFRHVSELVEGLRDTSNPNRDLHFDHYVTLLLFFFYNPIINSLRGLQKATTFPRVRKKLGIPRSSLGSLSAAQHVFDYEKLAPILEGLLEQLPADKGNPKLKELKEIVTVADGTLLRALPRVTWALWVSDDKRAAKAHVQFEVLKAAPSRVDVTAGNGCEKEVFAQALQPNRLYVLDSGYAKLSLFDEIVKAKSNLVCRIPETWHHEVIEERSLTRDDRRARVISDKVVRLGKRASKDLPRDVRLIEIARVEEPSDRMRRERPPRQTIRLVTDRLDLPAEVVALLYSERWKIEIFFRWLKCTLGCKKLVMESQHGAALQIYSALIACLLISLWTKKKPTKRMYEALCFYMTGLADMEDVLAAVEDLKGHEIGS